MIKDKIKNTKKEITRTAYITKKILTVTNVHESVKLNTGLTGVNILQLDQEMPIFCKIDILNKP